MIAGFPPYVSTLAAVASTAAFVDDFSELTPPYTWLRVSG